jgi:hypothetical protein
MFCQAIELTKRSCELCVQLRDHEEHAAKEMAAVDVVRPVLHHDPRSGSLQARCTTETSHTNDDQIFDQHPMNIMNMNS